MSVDRFRHCLAVMNLHKNDLVWFPKWVEGYANHHLVRQRMAENRQISGDDRLPVEINLVISFLQALRDNGVPAWRRLQAARSIDVYQTSVLRTTVVDFQPIRKRLQEIAEREKRLAVDPTNQRI